jgi:hypothetical protein
VAGMEGSRDRSRASRVRLLLSLRFAVVLAF